MAESLAAEARRAGRGSPALAWELSQAALRLAPGSPEAFPADGASRRVRCAPGRRRDPGSRRREKALEAVRASRADWAEIFIEQISREEDARVLTSLFAALGDRAAELSRKILRSPRIAPRAFVWLLERMHAEGRADSTALFVALTDAMRMDEFSSLRARMKELFEPGGLAVALVRLAASEEEARDLLHALDRVAGLEEHRRATVREALLMKFPELRAPAREYLYATAGVDRGDERQEMLHLKQVELPANAEAMKTAKEHGDLSENFEYHAARQKHEYLSARIATLADELSRTRVLDPARIDASEVRVGTRVRLRGDAGAERDVVDPRPLGLQARKRDLLVPVGVRPAAAGRPPGRPREPRGGAGRDRRDRAVGLRLARAAVLEAILLAATGLVALGLAEENVANIYRLPIGDPSRRDREVPVVLDAITDTATGALILPSELPKRLEGVRLLLVGESHTDMDSHRIELRVLEELVALGPPGHGRPRDVPLRRAGRPRRLDFREADRGRVSRGLALVQELGLPLALLPRHLSLCARPPAPARRDQRSPRGRLGGPQEGLPGSDARGGRAHPDRDRLEERGSPAPLPGVLRRVGFPRRHGRRRLAVHARRSVHLGRDDGLPRGPAAAERRGSEGHRRGARRRGARAVRHGHRAPAPEDVPRPHRVAHPRSREGLQARRDLVRPGVLRELRVGRSARNRSALSRSSASPRAHGPRRAFSRSWTSRRSRRPRRPA